MPDSNIDLVKRLFLAYQQGDFPTALGLLDPGVAYIRDRRSPGAKEVYTHVRLA
jgi:ketosteroid isomerase-like protein